MTISERYAETHSRRLDHPNLGDVAKTTYAKGTIVDFEETGEDDPIQVKSRVKVTGDFGESDYIPLFYHPKAEYWDEEKADPPVLATDFDEELGCFKQAWMSFRCGDEVAVMIQEGRPVAVVGFADGVPRVGEDIIGLQLSDEEKRYISVSKAQKSTIDGGDIANPYFTGGSYEIPSEGPDGLAYMLEETAEVASNDEALNYQKYGRNYGAGEYTSITYPNSKYYYKQQSLHDCRISVWPIPVGPIVVALYMSSLKPRTIKEWYRADTKLNGHGTAGETFTAGPYVSGAPLYVPDVAAFTLTCTDDGEWNQEDWDLWYNFWVVNIDSYGTPTGIPSWVEIASSDEPGDSDIEGDKYGMYYLEARAAIYTEELYDEILAAIGSIDPTDACGISVVGATLVFSSPDYEAGESISSEAPAALKTQLGLTYFLNDTYREFEFFEYEDHDCPDAINWFSRPHTKAELEAAGMWPAETA